MASLCVYLILFIVPLVLASEPYYAIIVPAQMTHSTQDKACVIILGLTNEVTLHMELKKDDKVQQITNDVINTDHHFHCYSFQYPAVKEDNEVWNMHVSLQGENIKMEQTKKILMAKNTLVTFIQTDKPLYKPGQTVNFRIVSMDMSFRANDFKYPMVEIKDPNGDRIAQWLEVSPDQGIASLHFSLAHELQLGEYTIIIPDVYQTNFVVSEYEMQRFGITIDVQPGLTVQDKAVTVNACGRYTYGKPVEGTTDLSVCKIEVPSWIMYFLDQMGIESLEAILPFVQDDVGECEEIKHSQTVDSDNDSGCIAKTFDLGPLNITESDNVQILKIKALVTEKSTGHTEDTITYSPLGSSLTITFSEKIDHYQKGVPLTIQLSVTGKDKKPMVNETVGLVVGFEEKEVNLTAATDIKGLATFELDTSAWDDMVSLEGKFLNEDDSNKSPFPLAQVWLHPFYSESNSFLKVTANQDSSECSDPQLINVGYIIKESMLNPKADHQSFFYFLVSKGAILTSGEYKLVTSKQSTGSELRGSFSLKLTKTIEMYPEAIFVVFTILLNGDVAAAKQNFQVPMCLNNKVMLKFSKDQVHPGSKISLNVKAESGSLCSVRSVDKGVLLQQQHQQLNLPQKLVETVSRELVVNRRGFPYKIEDFEKYPCLRNKKDAGPEKNEGPWYSSEADVYRLMKESNLKIFTNAEIRKPVKCDLPGANFTRRTSSARQNTLKHPLFSKKSEIKKAIRRRDFAETWLFDLVSVGPMGQAELNITAPHGITTYVTDAFCLGKSSGFGEISNVELTTFQNFFIDLILPFSVVQGEQFTITALVYNYMDDCNVVYASLSDVGDHSGLKNREQKRCICSKQSTKLSWNVTASQIGNQNIHVKSNSLQLKGTCKEDVPILSKDPQEDIIEKRVIVKPPGILEEKTQTSLLCPSGTSIQVEMSLDLPEGYVQGSQQAHFIVLGDLMGSAITNLGRTTKDPEGCAEENIMLFIPNYHIIKYLEATNQLTPEIKTKAITYLTKGYQRQMLFKSENGSYSLFTGWKPSAWLTAFTLRSFIHAQEIIYIPENVIDDAVRWLGSVQLPNGCFKKVGEVFIRFLQREDEDEMALTAYIAVTLLERRTHNGNILERALKCLKDSVDKVNSTYTQAVMAYAFTLSGDADLRNQILESLDAVAEKTENTKNWEADDPDHGAVEISAYVVLAILSDEVTSQRDIEEASSIIRWMAKKQSASGTFYSEQDTVVGLQAMTKYAKLTVKEKQEVSVSVRSLSGFQRQFNVDKTNSLLYQSELLPDIPGVYRVTTTGTGCVSVQTYLKYNMPAEESNTFFSLDVSTEPAECTSKSFGHFDIVISVSYATERPDGRIAIVEVDMLSGYLPSSSSLKKLQKQPGVGKLGFSEGKVTIYLNKLTHESKTLSFSVKQDSYVIDLQPAVVKVHDYFKPDESAVTTYNSPCKSASENEDNS